MFSAGVAGWPPRRPATGSTSSRRCTARCPGDRPGDGRRDRGDRSRRGPPGDRGDPRRGRPADDDRRLGSVLPDQPSVDVDDEGGAAIGGGAPDRARPPRRPRHRDRAGGARPERGRADVRTRPPPARLPGGARGGRRGGHGRRHPHQPGDVAGGVAAIEQRLGGRPPADRRPGDERRDRDRRHPRPRATGPVDPEDVSVVGFDDIDTRPDHGPATHHRPSTHPGKGEEAARLLLSVIAGRGSQPPVIAGSATRLVIRASTSSAPRRSREVNGPEAQRGSMQDAARPGAARRERSWPVGSASAPCRTRPAAGPAGPSSRIWRRSTQHEHEVPGSPPVAGFAIVLRRLRRRAATPSPSIAPATEAPARRRPPGMAPDERLPGTAPAGRPLIGELTVWHSYGSGAGTEATALKKVTDEIKAANPDLKLTISGRRSTTSSRSSSSTSRRRRPRPVHRPERQPRQGGPAQVLVDLTAHARGQARGFNQVSIDGCKVDGKFYMVPESLKAVAMYYDKSKVATAPATTDELLAGVKDGSVKARLQPERVPHLRLERRLRRHADGRHRQVRRRHHRLG